MGLRKARRRPAVTTVIIALFSVMALLGPVWLAAPAAAKPTNSNLSHDQFMAACAADGATPVDNADGTYECDFGDGGKIKCNDSACWYIPPARIAGVTGIIGTVGSGGLEANPGSNVPPTPTPTRVGSGALSGIVANKPGSAKAPPIYDSAIYVNAWTCPITVNYASDVNQLKAACKDLHNTNFEVLGTGVVTQFPAGDVRIGNLPAGTYTVRELIPNGYQLVQTYCNFVPKGSPPPADWYPVQVIEGYYEDFALGQSQTVYCNWFNLPNNAYTPTPTPGNTVTNVGVIKAQQATVPAATPGT